MLQVVPAEEIAAKYARLGEVRKRRGKLRLIFRGFEERFDVWVVIADVRAGMALGDAQIGEQERDRLGRHRTTIVGVDRELSRIRALLGDRFSEQNTSQLRAFAISDHPANDVPAVDVDDHVEIVVRPLVRAVQFCDVPGEHLTRRRCAEFGFYACGTRRLVAPVAHLANAVQDAVLR